jgi:protein-tyrosine kinase
VDASSHLIEEASRLLDLLNPTFVDGEGLAVQFIGSRKGEGTSTIARAFARVAMAHIAGDVLLLNLDLTDDSHFASFNRYGESLGLGALSGPLDVPLQTAQLVRLPSPAASSLAADVLMTFHRVGSSRLVINRFSQSSEMANAKIVNEGQFWQDVKKHFLLTVVDSPPFSDSPDGILVSQCMESVIIVVEADATRMPVVENLKSNLLGQGANIMGLVFNKRQFYIPKQIYHML